MPHSFIKLPHRLADVESASDAVQIAYLPFSDIGSYWAVFCGRNVRDLLDRQFVAVARFHPQRFEAAPEIGTLAPLMQVIALIPADDPHCTFSLAI